MSADHSAAQKREMCVCVRVHVPECNQMMSHGVFGGYGCSRNLPPLLIVSACLLLIGLILHRLLAVDLFVHGCRFDCFFVKVAINVPGKGAVQLY